MIAIINHGKEFLIKDKVLRVKGVDDAAGQIFLNSLFKYLVIVDPFVLDIIEKDGGLPTLIGE